MAQGPMISADSCYPPLDFATGNNSTSHRLLTRQFDGGGEQLLRRRGAIVTRADEGNNSPPLAGRPPKTHCYPSLRGGRTLPAFSTLPALYFLPPPVWRGTIAPPERRRVFAPTHRIQPYPRDRPRSARTARGSPGSRNHNARQPAGDRFGLPRTPRAGAARARAGCPRPNGRARPNETARAPWSLTSRSTPVIGSGERNHE
jgi:hypothetical protein